MSQISPTQYPGASVTPDAALETLLSINRSLSAATGIVGDITRRKASELEFRRRESERVADEEARIAAAQSKAQLEAEKGAAVLDADTVLPEISSQIRDAVKTGNKQYALADGETPAAAAPRWARELALSRQFREGTTGYDTFVERAQKQLAQDFAAQDAAARELLREDLATKVAASPDLEGAVAGLREIGFNEFEANNRAVLPRLLAAADRGNAEEFNRIAGHLSLDPRFDSQISQQRVILNGKIESAAAKQKADAVAYLSALTEATKNPASGQTYAGLSQAVENLRPALGDALANEKLAEVRNVIAKAQETQIASAQEQGANRAFALAEIGGLTREELQSAYLPRTLLPKSDPNYLSPEQYRLIDGRIDQKKEVDQVRSEVLGVLQGGSGIVTQQRHGKAITDVLREAGAITDSRITDPATVTGAVSQARMVPAEVVGAINASLRSDDANDVGGALDTIAGLSQQGFATAVADGVDPQLAPIVEVVRAAKLNGTLDTPNGRAKVQARIQLIKQNLADGKGPTKEQLAEVARGLGADKKFIDFIGKSIADDVAAVRSSFPQTQDTVPFAPDFLDPDPAIDAYDPGIARRMESWYAMQYQKLAPTLGQKEAAEGARAYAREQLTNSVDFIRWGNQVRPQLIDTGTNRLPEAMRWTSASEGEARDVLKERGANPDDVRTIAPLIDSRRQGWVFLDYDGLPMLDPQTNRVMLYVPSTEAQQAAKAAQTERMRRAAQFDRTGGRFEVANNFNAFSGF